MMFITDNHPAKVEQPGKEPFDFLASDVPAQRMVSSPFVVLVRLPVCLSKQPQR